MQLGYVIIYVPNVLAAVEFYEAAFGLRRRFVHESGYGEMDTGATALGFAAEALAERHGITIRPNIADDNSPAGAEIALVTTDLDTAYARAIAAGAQEVMEPTRKPWGQHVAYVRDLNGFLVELCTKVEMAG